MSHPKTVLVLGSTGYIGRHLVPRLLDKGYAVRALARDLGKAARLLPPATQIYEGDLLNLSSVSAAFDGADYIYYLVHSLQCGGDKFEEMDRRAAENTVWLADHYDIKRIIYLGALGQRAKRLSRHLTSRHTVGDILFTARAQVTEFRAAIVIGAEGASFKMIYYLVKRMPVIVCPLWIMVGTQPIALDDAIRYLTDSLEKPECAGKVLDICCPDIVTYCDIMESVARELGLNRRMVFIPVLTPLLSSLWVNLMAPVPPKVTRPLIEGLRHRTVCENTEALRIFDFAPMNLHDAVRIAVGQMRELADKSETNA